MKVTRIWQRAFSASRNPPGFEVFPVHTRLRLSAIALQRFVSSVAGLRFLAWLCIWLLAGNTLVWNFDLRYEAAWWPEVTACVWALPWLRRARRSQLSQMLKERGFQSIR